MILTIHTRHDANVTVSDTEHVETYLELEKIANVRYFEFSEDKDTFAKEFKAYVLPYIDVASIDKVLTCWVTPEQIEVLKQIFDKAEFSTEHHHKAHVYSAYMFTEPRADDLVLSIDGGGDLEDYFHIYEFTDGKLSELKEIKINLGKAYRIIGLLSPELYKRQSEGYQMSHALSGKKMSLQSYGKVRKEYLKPIENYYRNFMAEYDEEKDDVTLNLSTLLSAIGHGDEKFLDQATSRDVLATSQYVFEQLVKEHVIPYIQSGKYKRLVVVGGCALNVKLNSLLNDDYGIDVFTPPCANDGGISLGLAKIANPDVAILPTPFIKTSIKNPQIVDQLKKNFTQKEVTLKELAAYLADGKVIATIVGDIEIGPRALGQRSYLASPLIEGMKDKLNAPSMKDRELWRPVAPIVPLDKLEEYFDSSLPSPYMTFAPQVKKNYRKLLKEVLHIDGSARVQTVTSDNWVFDLLKEFGKITGAEILMNTSFNEKGHPLINDLEEAYRIFAESDLDGVIFSTENPTKDSRLQLFLKS